MKIAHINRQAYAGLNWLSGSFKKTASATKLIKKDSFYLFTSIDLYVIIYTNNKHRRDINEKKHD